MITGPNTYSKDPSIIPEGIAVTLPVAFFEDRGWTVETFCQMFERHMRKEDSIWNFKITNLPTIDVAFVYLVFGGEIKFRVNFVMMERGVTKTFNDSPKNGFYHHETANWIILSGPAVRPPHEWPQKGFQGFRYTTKLF
jgi:hypothetical protein